MEKEKKDAEARVELEKELDKEIEEGLKKKTIGKKIEVEEVEPKIIRLSKKQKRKAKAKEKAEEEAEEAEAQASPDGKLDEVLDRVNSSIDLYSQNNEDRKGFLQRKWTNFIPQIKKAIADDTVITNDMIRTKTEEFLDDYEKIQYLDLDVPQDVKARLDEPLPQPEAFIPEAQLRKGQQELDEQEADAIEKAFAQAQKEVEIPDSALEAIDRVNTQNAKEGKAINVLEGKTAKPAIAKRRVPKNLRLVYGDEEVPDAIKSIKANTKKGHPIKSINEQDIIDYVLANDIQVARNGKDFYVRGERMSRSQLVDLIKGVKPREELEDEDEVKSEIKSPEEVIAEAPPEEVADAQAQAKYRAEGRKKFGLPPVAVEPLIAITPTQSETDKDIAQVAKATVEADPTIAPADQDATASATADGFASGLKKVKKMHGKIIHDKVVKVMASQAGIQKGLNKVKKMHGGAMHDRVKGMLMKKFPSFFF